MIIWPLSRVVPQQRRRTLHGGSVGRMKRPQGEIPFPKLQFYRSFYSPSSPKKKKKIFRIGVIRKTGRVLDEMGVECLHALVPPTMPQAFLCGLVKAWPEKKERKKGGLYRLAKADRPPFNPERPTEETRSVALSRYCSNCETIKILKDRTQGNGFTRGRQSQPSWHWPLGNETPCPPLLNILFICVVFSNILKKGYYLFPQPPFSLHPIKISRRGP